MINFILSIYPFLVMIGGFATFIVSALLIHGIRTVIIQSILLSSSGSVTQAQ